MGSDEVAAALADPEQATLPDKVKAMLRLLTKVTLDHQALSAADVAPVLAAGASPKAIVEALNVGFAFNVITRLADAFQFEVPPAASFQASAKRLLSHGYNL